MSAPRRAVLTLLLACACGRSAPRSIPAAPSVRFAATEVHQTCSLRSAARAAAPPTAIDCGEARDEAERLKAWACIQAARAEQRPFVAMLRYPGVDSVVAQALLGMADGSISELWYDSDPTGANAEHRAHLTRRACGDLRPNEVEASWFDCVSPGRGRTLCRGTEFELGPARAAGSLVCQAEEDAVPGLYACSPGLPIGVPEGVGNWAPPARDSELACLVEPGGVYRCASTPGADAFLGLRTERRQSWTPTP